MNPLNMSHQNTLTYAAELDHKDPLNTFRSRFYIPQVQGREAVYFLGNSLGLQPRATQDEVLTIMENWANFGVEGFFMGSNPWLLIMKNIAAFISHNGRKRKRAGGNELSHRKPAPAFNFFLPAYRFPL